MWDAEEEQTANEMKFKKSVNTLFVLHNNLDFFF